MVTRSTVLKWIETQKQAESGDRDAIVQMMELFPIATLKQSMKVGQHIDRIARKRTQESREYIERLVRAFRKGLLRPVSGRPKRIENEAVQFANEIQEAFDGSPICLKRTYRNSAAQEMAIRDLSKHVTSRLPNQLRKRTETAMVEVLGDKPGTRRGLGVQVAAKVFLCSSRYIRSLQKAP